MYSVKSGDYEIFFDLEDKHLVENMSLHVRLLDGRPVSVISNNVTPVARLLIKVEDDQVVDHIDGNPLNNSKRNLRAISHADNMKNRRVHKNNKIGFKGVYKHHLRPTYCAELKLNGKKYRKFGFKTPEEAAVAYNEMSLKHHGEFGRLNDL